MNRAANATERGTPWPGDWKPHRKLTAVMLGDHDDGDAAGGGGEVAPEDTPLALTQRLLCMAAIQQRASAAWDAAKDINGRVARCGTGQSNPSKPVCVPNHVCLCAY